MANAFTICIVDDDSQFGQGLSQILQQEGYLVHAFETGGAFLDWFASGSPDLVITDIAMPDLNGYELCERIRDRISVERIPVVMVTGSNPPDEEVRGLKAGADEFIQKPIHRAQLVAKIESLLSIRAHGIERVDRLSKFIPPNIAELIVRDPTHSILAPHRANVTVIFTDLRGFTSFTEFMEPEEVMAELSQYYRSIGDVCVKNQATLGHLAGDGVMAFLNDPVPMYRHQDVAVEMALEIREALTIQRASWRERGFKLDFGIGIAEGEAMIGGVGFDRFWAYTVIGPVTNLAARLCQVAVDGQILVSDRFKNALAPDAFETEFVGESMIKGLQVPLKMINVSGRAVAKKKAA